MLVSDSDHHLYTVAHLRAHAAEFYSASVSLLWVCLASLAVGWGYSRAASRPLWQEAVKAASVLGWLLFGLCLPAWNGVRLQHEMAEPLYFVFAPVLVPLSFWNTLHGSSPKRYGPVTLRTLTIAISFVALCHLAFPCNFRPVVTHLFLMVLALTSFLSTWLLTPTKSRPLPTV